MRVKRGLFVVLEGIDGAGTTTQLRRLAGWLEGLGHAVHPTFEPSGGPIGRHIRKVLRGEEGPPHPDVIALLFAADRVDHYTSEIGPRLDAGAHVITDRYVGSSLAYQGSQSEPGWVRAINGHAPPPDLTLYVRVDPRVALARIAARDGERRELFEKQEILERIAAAYDRVYGAGGGPAELGAVVVDGERPPDEVFAACRDAMSDILGREEPSVRF